MIDRKAPQRKNSLKVLPRGLQSPKKKETAMKTIRSKKWSRSPSVPHFPVCGENRGDFAPTSFGRRNLYPSNTSSHSDRSLRGESEFRHNSPALRGAAQPECSDVHSVRGKKKGGRGYWSYPGHSMKVTRRSTNGRLRFHAGGMRRGTGLLPRLPFSPGRKTKGAFR